MAGGIRRNTDRWKWQRVNRGMLSAGSSTASLAIKDNITPLDFYFKTNDTAGAVRALNLDFNTATASTGNMVEVLRAELNSEVRTGAWANAVYGLIDYGTAGFPHGMAAAICAEMIPMNASLTRGALYALDLEFGCGASASWGSAGPVAFFKMENWGTATYFSANAFLFHLAGETGAAGALLGANSNTLKVRIGTTTEYLVLSEYEDTLSIGLTGAKKTLVTGVPEIAVWSTSALTAGTQDVVKIDFVQTAAQQTGYIKGIRCTMTSDVKTPASFNAIKGIIDYSTNGHAHGDCAPLASELTLPNSVAARGAYYGIEAQISAGASSNVHSTAGPLAFMHFKALGTVLELETYGYLLHLDGIGAATAGEIFDTCVAPAASHALKILIGTTPYYILLQSNVDAA